MIYYRESNFPSNCQTIPYLAVSKERLIYFERVINSEKFEFLTYILFGVESLTKVFIFWKELGIQIQSKSLSNNC